MPNRLHRPEKTEPYLHQNHRPLLALVPGKPTPDTAFQYNLTKTSSVQIEIRSGQRPLIRVVIAVAMIAVRVMIALRAMIAVRAIIAVRVLIAIPVRVRATIDTTTARWDATEIYVPHAAARPRKTARVEVLASAKNRLNLWITLYATNKIP